MKYGLKKKAILKVLLDNRDKPLTVMEIKEILERDYQISMARNNISAILTDYIHKMQVDTTPIPADKASGNHKGRKFFVGYFISEVFLD